MRFSTEVAVCVSSSADVSAGVSFRCLVSNKKEQGSYGAYEVDGGEHYARRAGHVAQGKEYAE